MDFKIDDSYLEKTIDWKDAFTLAFNNRMENTANRPQIEELQSDGNEIAYNVNNFRVNISLPVSYSDTFTRENMNCSCRTFESTRVCPHVYRAIEYYAEHNGPIVVKETKYEHIKRIKEYREKIKKEGKVIPVTEYLRKTYEVEESADNNIIDIDKIFEGCMTTELRIEQAEKLNSTNGYYYGYGRRQGLLSNYSTKGLELKGNLEYYFNSVCVNYDIVVGQTAITKFSRVVSKRYYIGYRNEIISETDNFDKNEFFDEYDLYMFAELYKTICENVNIERTDQQAMDLFNSISAGRDDEEEFIDEYEEDEVFEKDKCLEIIPRIKVHEDFAELTFRVGMDGKKPAIYKDINNLAEEIDVEGELYINRRYVSLRENWFKDSCAHIIDMIRAINDRIKKVNKIIDASDRNSGYYYTVPHMDFEDYATLEGEAMDLFFEHMEGRECLYMYQSSGVKNEKTIVVGTKYSGNPIAVTMDTYPLRNTAGDISEINVSGYVPVISEGENGFYAFGEAGIIRIPRQKSPVVSALFEMANKKGFFSFSVGKNSFQEFYSRVVPELMDNSFIDYKDEYYDRMMEQLPPEPEFVMYADIAEEKLRIECKATYGDREYPLCDDVEDETGIRDMIQESRVERAIREYCPLKSGSIYFSNYFDEDDLYIFLTKGVRHLSKFGEVKGSEALRKEKVMSSPTVKMDISVSGIGLLDLKVTSRGISDDDLVEILESYEQKKKYYHLSSGGFVRLSGQSGLSELSDMMDAMDISARDVIAGNVELPMYRALYVDKLLKEHDAIATSRDKVYKALIRDFNSIKDSDFDPPASLDDTLRNYQNYGHKWLRTLEKTGFGGILADEMGLGKTLQLISVLLAAYNDGNRIPSLIVVPASVVYNWQEELKRFAPEMPCVTLAGPKDERAELIGKIGGDEEGTVYVTSYDLLKRDIAQYEGINFYVCALDEAQMIKNRNALAAKSVKVIKAAHRFALTGTPIENRLAELWSIFDFLMPGFLYSSKEFSEKYEKPISKDRDETATQKLKGMVSPFILRRRKKDVLKDLPDKLEEVKYARLEEEQQKLYDGQVVKIRQIITAPVDDAQRGREKIRLLAEITKLRQICCDPSLVVENYKGTSAKREALIDLVLSALDGDHKMLIFSQFTSMLDLIKEDLKKNKLNFYEIVGSTPKEKRLALAKKFNSGDDVRIFLVSLKAGGTGLNLTGADVVIHYDPWWNTAAQDQATDRAHRIGQEREVNVLKLIAKDTIEEKIIRMQEEKQDLADAILEGEGKNLMSMTDDELLQLFN